MLRKNNDRFFMEMTSYDVLQGPCCLSSQNTGPENQLLFAANGVFHVRTPKTQIKVPYRNLMYLHRNVPYALEIPEGNGNLVYRLHFLPSPDPVHLDLDTLCQNNENLDAFMHFRNRYSFLTDREQIATTINELIREFDLNSPQKDVMMTAHLTILFTKMSRSFSTKRNISGIHYVSKAKAYIAEHSSEALNIRQIADNIGISSSHLEALFAKYAGRRITTHINTVRVDKAASLLMLTQKEILEIALEVGYENRQHFAREFKKRYGISPSQYRKLYGETPEGASP